MLVQCGGGVNPIIIHSVTSLFNGYIQSLVEVNQAIVAWLFTLTHRQKSSNKLALLWGEAQKKMLIVTLR